MARLDGRTVVVTRGNGDSDALGDRLRALGASVRELPSIAIGPPESWGPLDDALRALDGFDWVIFASGNGVDRTLERMAALDVPVAALAARKLAAVGPATALRLARGVRAPDLVPGEAKGEALAAELAPRVRGRKVLLPRAADGRPELPRGLAAAGALLTAPDAYRTVPAPAETLRPLAGWIAGGEIDAVTFASPSAVKAVTGALGPEREALRKVLLSVIGPTTAAALRDAGFEVGAMPSEYTAPALAEAIAARLGPGSRSS
jgi:uroporphyrinogen-III synthase/uroporphyrinogen III methyltransferase/synthase